MSDDWVSYGEYKTHIGKAQAIIAQLEAELQHMAEELHAAINEPMYAGTRADWMWRAQKAEAEVELLKAKEKK